MTTLRAYAPVDMLDYSLEVGSTIIADLDLLVVETASQYTYYFGDFTYPGDRLEGTVRGVQTYDYWDETLIVDVRGLDLDTRHFTEGASLARTTQLAFTGDDRIIGSVGDDRLSGFDGSDIVRGQGGDDRLSGMDGRDAVYGGGGDDQLRGGRSKDALDGGSGDDAVWGGHGRDMFRFHDASGRDVIGDFVDREDKIEIEGPTGMRDLAITFSERGHATIMYLETEIVVRNADADVISSGDFLFV